MLKAKRTVAFRTMEMRMFAIKFAITICITKRILERSRTIIYSMYHSMGMEECQGAEDTGFINGVKQVVEIKQ